MVPKTVTGADILRAGVAIGPHIGEKCRLPDPAQAHKYDLLLHRLGASIPVMMTKASIAL